MQTSYSQAQPLSMIPADANTFDMTIAMLLLLTWSFGLPTKPPSKASHLPFPYQLSGEVGANVIIFSFLDGFRTRHTCVISFALFFATPASSHLHSFWQVHTGGVIDFPTIVFVEVPRHTAFVSWPCPETLDSCDGHGSDCHRRTHHHQIIIFVITIIAAITITSARIITSISIVNHARDFEAPRNLNLRDSFRAEDRLPAHPRHCGTACCLDPSGQITKGCCVARLQFAHCCKLNQLFR